ncbi:MAG: UDP-N-acetylmuramoyl-L-alanine--D-glutamate ligase [Candidatus Moranbacteria bacterium]|nr:UDP-N-acetylmuramoyl-L-alanine--D-glutamate ligase [Candidatus Moranbacteria bacterium]
MLQESFFKDKRITVFGLGLNTGGVGTVKFLVERGVREVIVTDIKSREELEPSLQKLAKYKNVTYVLGQHRPENFTHVDMVIKNPVIPWTNEYVKLAEKHGVPVEMDSSIFFALCRVPIIGVTGAKGKTTTATLIAHILEKAGKSVTRVGIGQAGVLGTLGDITPESVVVFELSSWRLSALGRLKKSPHVAVLTNIYPDHLNYYKTMAAYIADKKNIFLFQKQKDILVASFDDVEIRTMAQDAKGILLWFSKGLEVDGDGAWVKDEKIYIRRQGSVQELLPLEHVPFKGEHNMGNIVAAVVATLAYGISPKQIASGIRSFVGLPHRLEYIGEKKGVGYYNDTAATIPEATIAALRSFTEPVILIAGGSDKRLDFGTLAKEILKRSKGLILFKGDATEKLLQALKEALPAGEKERSFEVVESMAKAVELATRGAEPGDIVLLSPGATSFGIFKNEFDRGEQFRKSVSEL